MLYLKLILALMLVMSGFGLAKLKDLFIPLLIFYFLLSSISFYLLFRETFIIYYSGAEVQITADGVGHSARLFKNWVPMLILLGFIYSLPCLFFISALRARPYMILLLVAFSLLPDIKREYVWEKLIIEGEPAVEINS